MDGFRESADNWSDLLKNLKDWNLKVPPAMAHFGSGQPCKMYFPEREQRCWVKNGIEDAGPDAQMSA